jgi:hypothetical protein
VYLCVPVCSCAPVGVPVGGWVRVQSWERTRLLGVWYVSDAGTATWISLFGTFLILFNTLIPISLYVTLEAVKLVQAMLMGAHGPSSATRRERERERHTHTHDGLRTAPPLTHKLCTDFHGRKSGRHICLCAPRQMGTTDQLTSPPSICLSMSPFVSLSAGALLQRRGCGDVRR